jgi:hypothetical protein
MEKFSESQDWLHNEESSKRNQLNHLEKSFYSSHARIGLSGFIFDCIAGKQEEVDLESGAQTQKTTVDTQPSFMEEPITFALISSTQMIMTAVSGIASGISNLFSWRQPKPQEQQNLTQPDTNINISNNNTCSDLFEVVIEGEIQKTLQNIRRSFEALPFISFENQYEPSSSKFEIESPKMSDIFLSDDTEAGTEKEHLRSYFGAPDVVDTTEYVDSGNYWYYGPEDGDDEEGEIFEEKLSDSFESMKSYIDFSQDAQIVIRPIKKKRNKDQKSKVHFEPMVELMDNVVNNDKAAIKKILQEGAIKVNDQDKLGYTMLHYAASHGHIDLIKFLVEKGGEINALDLTNWTPLHLAAIADNYKTCKLLLELGANFECPNNDEQLPVDLTEDAKVKKLLSDATKKKMTAKKAKAIYDFTAGTPECLNLKKSETVKVLDRRQKWWLVQNESKQIGLVPRSYVQ